MRALGRLASIATALATARRFDLGDRYQNMFTLAGLLGLGFFFKLFEYLGLNKRMRVIWLTLYESRIDLIAYIAGFMLLVFGFSLAGASAREPLRCGLV